MEVSIRIEVSIQDFRKRFFLELRISGNGSFVDVSVSIPVNTVTISINS